MGFTADTPVVAGTTLVRSAIQSPNYVAGSTGWSINQDGSVEFSSAVIRGTFSAGGGNVTLTAAGLVILGAGLRQAVNSSAGFISTANPSDGSLAQLADIAGFGGGVFLSPPSPTPNSNTISSVATISARTENPSGTTERTRLQITSGTLNSLNTSSIDLRSQDSASATNNAFINLNAPVVSLPTGQNPIPALFIDGNDIGRGFHVGVGTTAGVALTTTETVIQTVATKDFKPGRVYKVVATGSVTPSAAATCVIRIRKTNTTGQQFDVWRLNTPTALSYEYTYICYFQVGAATVNASIVMTMTMSAGTGTLSAGATSPATVFIYDDGDSSGRSFLTTLV